MTYLDGIGKDDNLRGEVCSGAGEKWITGGAGPRGARETGFGVGEIW